MYGEKFGTIKSQNPTLFPGTLCSAVGFGALLVVKVLGPLEHPIVEPFSIVNAEDLHALVVVKVGQQLGSDQEILSGAPSTGLLHQLGVY